MSNSENADNTETAGPGGKQPASLVLIGFSVGVLVLFAVMLNNPGMVAECGSKLFGWQTPKQECINNLKQIDGAVQQWALENKKFATDTYSLTDTNLLEYLKGSVLPRCPLGGRYTGAPNIAGCPTCSVPGHTL